MPRFAWATWGLLLVVLDLRVGDWDVLPDLVGYVWIAVALGGAALVGRPFVVARAAALVGAVAAAVTGTPLQSVSLPLLVVALVAQALAFATVLGGLATGIAERLPASAERARPWAVRMRWAAIALGVVLVIADPAVYVVTTGSSLAGPVTLLWLLARLAEAVIGILAVVLVHRVARAGWLAPARA